MDDEAVVMQTVADQTRLAADRNTAAVTPYGEWEAWFLSSWAPGVQRYRSFGDLIQAEDASVVQLERPRG